MNFIVTYWIIVQTTLRNIIGAYQKITNIGWEMILFLTGNFYGDFIWYKVWYID